MHAKHITVVVVGAFIGVAVALMLLPEARSRIFAPAHESAGAAIGGPFTLTDVSGKQVTDRDYRGKYMLVFFGYTSCPDICPTALQTIAGALEKLGSKAEAVAPIFISVDPERDAPEKLRTYVRSFDPRIVGLTGTRDEVAAAAKAYRVYFSRVPGKDGEYTIDHSAIIYLMDPDGRFATHFNAGATSTEIAAKLSALVNHATGVAGDR
jgi:protein SCO1/2